MVKTIMINSELDQKNSLKACYGTNEWSANSGICRNCKLKEGCGKVNLRQLKD